MNETFNGCTVSLQATFACLCFGCRQFQITVMKNVVVCGLQTADDMERGEADGRLEGEWPRRPFKRGRKVNVLGTIIMSIYVMALIFYLWVRISKTLQLGPKPYVM